MCGVGLLTLNTLVHFKAVGQVCQVIDHVKNGFSIKKYTVYNLCSACFNRYWILFLIRKTALSNILYLTFIRAIAFKNKKERQLLLSQ